MQILLTTLNAKYIHLNLAIRLLYELNKDNKNLQWREFTIKDDAEKVAQDCAKFDIVAFSCYIWNITQTLAICKRIKEISPNTKILLGGPEVSYDWQEVIALPYIDFIIEGEGEIPFTDFLNQYPNVSAVPSLIYKIQDAPIKNISAPNFSVSDFAHTNPYANEEPSNLNNKVLYIETSRGCPYKCEFCLASLDNKVRYLPIDYIKQNLTYLMTNGRTIKFLDRTFNIKKDFTIDIFSFIVERYKPGQKFQFEITADIVHPDIITYINEYVPAGLLRFEIGIQTVNQVANLEVSRKQNFEKTKSIIKQLQHKVELHLDLIVGLPLDYYEDIKYSFEEVFKLFAPELQLGFLKFLKGTPMRAKAAEHGYKYDPIAPYQIIESKYLSAQQLHDITLLEHCLEIYWNNGKAPYTSRYVALKYSIFDFFVGLGKAFASKRDLHKFTLSDVYDILSDYALSTFPEDKILLQLIALDYYSNHKVRPQERFIADMEKAEKRAVASENSGLEQFGKRNVVLKMGLDLKALLQDEVVLVDGVYVVGYSGVEWPKVSKLEAQLCFSLTAK
jgi:anaerobic magnesium-protoporphyrin IX monomethyl ester cyclase